MSDSQPGSNPPGREVILVHPSRRVDRGGRPHRWYRGLAHRVGFGRCVGWQADSDPCADCRRDCAAHSHGVCPGAHSYDPRHNASSNAASLPSVAPSATTPVPANNVLMVDDFSSPRNAWLSEVTEQAEKGYEDGEFHITVYQPEYSTWSNPNPPRDFADFALEVDARRVSGPLNNEFGVLVRYQPETDAFYLFAISSDGFYSVEKYQADKWQQLVKWTESAAIRQGDAVNRLRVTGQGAKMRFFVNGEPLTQVEDASFRSGSIGLLASAAEKGGVTVAFDNLRVRPLAEP